MEEEWQAEALCKAKSNSIWFPPESADRKKKIDDAKAKSICKQCPVQQPCLEYAVANREYWGVWGGTTFEERKHLMNKRDNPRCFFCKARTVNREGDVCGICCK